MSMLRGRAAAMLPAMVLLAAVLPVPVSDAGQVLPQKLAFDVVREGAVVGQHRITFHQEGGKLLVHSELAIQVKVLFVTAYRYEQTREEVWRDGKLIAFTSTTDDDGTRYAITGAAGPKGIEVTSGKDSWMLPAESLPASYWNVSMVAGHSPLVDPQSGKVLDARFIKVGQEAVEAGGEKIAATHYTIAGERPHDVWYDASGRWVRLRTLAPDGSVAEWVLK